MINVSFSTGTYKPVHSYSLTWAKPFYKPLSNEAVYLSTRTELNHRNSTVCKTDMQVQFLVGVDSLNRSTRINIRIKRELTFLQVSCDHKKTKTVPCGELFWALPLSGSSLIIKIQFSITAPLIHYACSSHFILFHTNSWCEGNRNIRLKLTCILSFYM